MSNEHFSSWFVSSTKGMKTAGNPEQQQVVDTNLGDGESTLGGRAVSVHEERQYLDDTLSAVDEDPKRRTEKGWMGQWMRNKISVET
jgi:hypothetical protein